MMATKQEILRDQKLRRQIVDTLYASFTAGAGRPLAGDVVYDFANDDGGYAFEDSDHFIRLARELMSMGLIAEQPGETRRRGEAVALRHSRWHITPQGVQLCLEQIKPVAGVWDDRVV
jgi:hypothetical protein